MIFCLVFAKYLSELKAVPSNIGRKIIEVFISKCTFLSKNISMKFRKSD
jgi:hypothetical protein